MSRGSVGDTLTSRRRYLLGRRPGTLMAALAVTAVAIAGLPGCGEAADDGDSTEADVTAAGADDLPWEVTTDQGESVLPNVFYAEASENEQVMPTAINGHHQIDR